MQNLHACPYCGNDSPNVAINMSPHHKWQAIISCYCAGFNKTVEIRSDFVSDSITAFEQAASIWNKPGRIHTMEDLVTAMVLSVDDLKISSEENVVLCYLLDKMMDIITSSEKESEKENGSDTHSSGVAEVQSSGQEIESD